MTGAGLVRSEKSPGADIHFIRDDDANPNPNPNPSVSILITL